MTIQELTEGLKYAQEQLYQAELKLDQVTDETLIDAAIYEQKAWEERCKFYNRKLREAFKGGQAIQRNGLVYFGGKR